MSGRDRPSAAGRRAFLRGAAALSSAAAFARLGEALAAGTVELGVHSVKGEAFVNGIGARQGTIVRPGDAIRTGGNGELVFVLGRDAFLVRPDSRLQFTDIAVAGVTTVFRITTGAVLSVFERGPRKRIEAPTATMGIRGTALYVEATPERTYVCTCYGSVEITPYDDPGAAETVTTSYHDAPRFVYRTGAAQMMTPAPVFNHTDAELILLEALQGREPPFGNRPVRY